MVDHLAVGILLSDCHINAYNLAKIRPNLKTLCRKKELLFSCTQKCRSWQFKSLFMFVWQFWVLMALLCKAKGTIIKCIQSFDLIRHIQPSFTLPMKYPLFHCSDILQLQQHVQCIINIVSLWNYLLIPGVMPFLCTVRQLKTPSIHSKTSCI